MASELFDFLPQLDRGSRSNSSELKCHRELGLEVAEWIAVDTPNFRLQICNACCCGTEEKHPDIDHERQRASLSEAAQRGGGIARVVDCLGECHASNVVVVLRPNEPADWIGWIVDDVILDDVCEWLADGASRLPARVAPHVIERSKTSESG